ncbi:MAG TPA: hypothetical protein VKC52_07600 [Acidimicrobiia bacterium]|nr:hypothetical protein [Acidimicrobiia bacterium]
MTRTHGQEEDLYLKHLRGIGADSAVLEAAERAVDDSNFVPVPADESGARSQRARSSSNGHSENC